MSENTEENEDRKEKPKLEKSSSSSALGKNETEKQSVTKTATSKRHKKENSRTEPMRKHKPKDKLTRQDLDRRGLEEFVAIITEWSKTKNSKDSKLVLEAAQKSLNKFVTANHLENTKYPIDPVRIVSQLVNEERTKSQERFNLLSNAMRMCGSTAQVVRQLLQSFISFYHMMSTDHGGSTSLSNPASIEGAIKSIYHSMEKELGWTLEEEMNIFKNLPVKGEYPPPEFKIEQYDEYEEKMLPEMARPATEKLHSLPALLRRFQGEFAFKSTAISFPKVDVDSLTTKEKTPPGIQSGDIKSPLSLHIQTECSKLFGFSQRGGNFFACTRASLCFLMHAQTVIDVLSKVPLFSPIINSSSSQSTNSTKLDLLRNIPVASTALGQKPHQNELADARKKLALLTYNDRKTLAHLMKALEIRPHLTCSPRTDLAHVAISMFFDSPFNYFKKELEKQLRTIQVTQLAFLPSGLNFAPFFLHQDSEFLAEYHLRNPMSEYSQAFLSSNKSKEKKSEVSKNKIPEGNLFRSLSENSQKVAESIHQLNTSNSVEKAHLFVSLLRQSTSPDIVTNIQSSSDLSKYEQNSINYVNRRYLSSVNFEMLRTTMRTITSYAYPYYHQTELNTHNDEMLQRFCSLLLGYDHAYKESERPQTKIYLDIDYIIPFLYRTRNNILDFSKHQDTPILGLEYEFAKSPLVQSVLKIARDQVLGRRRPLASSEAESEYKDEINSFDAHTVINQLYSLWEETKVNHHSSSDLYHFIIKLICPTRYSNLFIKEVLKDQIEKVEAEVNFWSQAERQLKTYMTLVTTETPELSTSMVDNINVSANSFHDHDDSDAQLPSEIL